MRLYLDDDSASAVLAGLLRQAGHDVLLPGEAGLSGSHDPIHLTRAVQEQRACLTRDHNDFKALHYLILAAQGHHPGILVVRSEKDPKKKMKPYEIVKAVAKLEAAGVPLADGYIDLNHWR